MERIELVQEKSGFIPNVFLALAYRSGRVPGVLRLSRRVDGARFRAHQGRARDDRRRHLRRQQLPVLRHVAHGAILPNPGQESLIADQVAINYLKADITERQQAMLDFALQVSLDQGSVSPDDFAALEQHGFTTDDIWDGIAAITFFALSDRMANVTAMRPNDEFFGMAR
ncbi:MAG: hypothetical protein R2710_29785 [Acidimicrobiales bacterium]